MSVKGQHEQAARPSQTAARAASDGGERRAGNIIARALRPLFLVAALAAILAVPYMSDDYVVGLFVNVAIFGVVTMSWNLVFGHAGVFSLGQMAFFAVGGYAAGLANIHWGLSPWAALFFGGLIAGFTGLAMGIPSLRLYGPYMVLFTLAFQLVLTGLLDTVWTDTTGGSSGLFGVDVLAVGHADTLLVGFYAAVGMVVVTAAAIVLLLRSPIGNAIGALKEGRVQAEARGISLFQHRVIVFAFSAALTGVAGAFYTVYFGIVTPAVLSLGLLVNLLAWMVMGGLGTQLGPIIGAGLGVYLDDRLAEAQEYSALIWGLVLIVIVALAPGGLVAAGTQILRWFGAFALSLVSRGRERPPLPSFPGWAAWRRRSSAALARWPRNTGL